MNVINGTTQSGFAFQLNADALDNMELIDALAAVRKGEVAEVSTVGRMLLGADGYRALYDHLRTEDDRVPISDVIQELDDIFKAQPGGKNESSSPI